VKSVKAQSAENNSQFHFGTFGRRHGQNFVRGDSRFIEDVFRTITEIGRKKV
jgi:hypothetical protein